MKGEARFRGICHGSWHTDIWSQCGYRRSHRSLQWPHSSLTEATQWPRGSHRGNTGLHSSHRGHIAITQWSHSGHTGLHSGNTGGSQSSHTVATHLPVVVHVAQLKRESLHVVGLQAIVIVDDVVVSGTDRAPASNLADQVEVIPEGRTDSQMRAAEEPPTAASPTPWSVFPRHLPAWACCFRVHHGARRWVLDSTVHLGKEAQGTPPPDHHHRQLGAKDRIHRGNCEGVCVCMHV